MTSINRFFGPQSINPLARTLLAGVVGLFTGVGLELAAVAKEPAIKSGERIVFLGDSITQAGNAAGGYVTLAREEIAKRYPHGKIEVIGAGISGNRVPDLEARLDRDVISKKPTLVVIYIGINDVWHSLNGRGTPKEQFRDGLLRLVKRIHDNGARVIICTASVIGEKTDGSNQLDQMLDEFCSVSREVAKQTGSSLLDLRQLFLAHLQTHNSDQKERGVLTTDGVHLNAAGNRFVADRMLEVLGVREEQLLRHVVLFRFKENTTPEQLREIEQAFATLPSKIEVIHSFEWGTDVSVENLHEGFTHCFLVTFRSKEDRETYLPHPAHKAFVDLIKPQLDKAMVVDYWTRE